MCVCVCVHARWFNGWEREKQLEPPQKIVMYNIVSQSIKPWRAQLLLLANLYATFSIAVPGIQSLNAMVHRFTIAEMLTSYSVERLNHTNCWVMSTEGESAFEESVGGGGGGGGKWREGVSR